MVLIVLAVIAIAWGIGARLFIAEKTNSPESPLAAVSFAYSKNAQGQPWAIQTGESDFTVASKETYPRFVLGTINPTKVSIGDIQTMQIVVRDDVPLTKVWAEVEHDHGTDSIPLVLGASSTVSYNTIKNQKYLVGSDGKLVINDGQHNTPAVVALIQSLFNKANAEQAADYSYSGSWVVHDTATITYHTTFYAMDAQGRTTKLVLAWSDPCNISTSGYLTAACNLTSATDGVNDMNFSLSNYSLTLGPSGVLAVNPSRSIVIGTGQMIMSGGSAVTNKYLYYLDADKDYYAASSLTEQASTVQTPQTTIGGVNYTLTTNVTGGQFSPSLDCNDTNSTYGAGAHPGQSNWWVGTGGTSGWTGTPGDYNCNGTLEGGWALQTGATNYSPSAVQATVYPYVVCTAYLGSAFYTNGGGSPNYSCGTGPAYTGSVFYVGSGSGCNGGLTFMGYGTPVSVCR